MSHSGCHINCASSHMNARVDSQTHTHACMHTEQHTKTNSVLVAIPCAGGSSCSTIPSKTLSVDKSDDRLGTNVGQPRSDESFGISVGLCKCLSQSEFIFFFTSGY